MPSYHTCCSHNDRGCALCERGGSGRQHHMVEAAAGAAGGAADAFADCRERGSGVFQGVAFDHVLRVEPAEHR